MTVWYSPELDVLIIQHPPGLDNETGRYGVPIEWDCPDLVAAQIMRSRYNGIADLHDLFDWVLIGDFD